MYKLVSGIIFWLIGVSAFSQVTISVTDQPTGKHLDGATVVVISATNEVTFIADDHGIVQISTSAFPIRVTASYIGFDALQIEVPGPGNYSIKLVPASAQLDEIVVTGQFEPQSVRQSVYQVRTITNDRIVLRSPVNVQGILATELGIRFSTDLTLGTSDISLMGMNGRNVKILLDGIPLLDRGDTRESLNQIDVNTIERIEIVEGPMSVMYGSDALAGVINIITKKYQDNKLVLEAKIHEETAGDEYELFAGEGVHNESVNINWGSKKIYAGGGFSRNTFGGWNESRVLAVSPYGDGEWHPKDQYLPQGTIGYRNNSLDIAYKFNYLYEKVQLVGNAVIDGQTTFTDKDYITNRFNHQLQADWQINGRWSFAGAASYQDLSRRTLTTNYNSITRETTLSTEPDSQAKALFDMAMIRGFFLYKLNPKLSLQPGFEINYSTGSGDRIDHERSISDYAAFVSAEYKPMNWLNVRPGLRFIYNTAYEAPPAIPSLNAKITLNHALNLRVAYAYGFRSPALRELYFYFYDASHSIEGNPDLKAEYSNSFSSSLTWNGSLNTINIKSVWGIFYNRFDNMIDLALFENTAIYKYYNVYKYKTLGVTLENNFYWKKLSVTLGGSYIGRYNQFIETDESLPEMLWSTEVNAVASYAIEKTGTTLSGYYKFTGRRQSYSIDPTPDPDVIALGEIEGYHFLDGSINQQFLKNFTATIGVKNLLDVTMLNNTQSGGGTHSSGGTVSMSYGRSYFMTLAYKWSN